MGTIDIFKYSVVLVIIFTFLGTLTFSQTISSFVVLNEVQVNNPGADQVECEYVEMRGDPGTLVTSNIFLVEIEGDGAGAGTADYVRDLSFQSIGSNGIFTVHGSSALLSGKGEKGEFGGIGLQCGSRSYTSNGGLEIEDGVSLENGTISFLLINSPTTAIVQGTDYDTDNNGTLELLPMDATIIDAVGWSDDSSGGPDWVYGGVDISPGNARPDAATRNFSDITPLSLAAWFSDDIVGTSPDAVLYDQTNLTGGFRIDFITPGRQNLAPSAATGSIAGRAKTAGGTGLKFVTLRVTGGNLPEPIYSTTNHFGYYRFEGMSIGETYVLQVISSRYRFENPTRVISLDDNISGLDFVVENNGVKSE